MFRNQHHAGPIKSQVFGFPLLRLLHSVQNDQVHALQSLWRVGVLRFHAPRYLCNARKYLAWCDMRTERLDLRIRQSSSAGTTKVLANTF